MTHLFRRILFIIAAISAVALAGCTSMGGTGSDKVVYHINDSANAIAVIRNAGNHLDVDPTAKIVVVSHSQGVDFLMNDARDPKGNPYNIGVEKLVARGVTFDVCQKTLQSRSFTQEQFIPEVKFVPSGVGEITKLQAREGYVYLKP